MKEIWYDIPEYEGIYKISNFHRVKNIVYRGKQTIAKGYINAGYMCVSLTKNMIRKAGFLHKLIATVFIPNPKNFKVVNHRDGNKLNNAVWNLEWCDKSHDVKEAHRLGLSHGYSMPGEKHPSSKLKSKDLKYIKKQLGLGVTQKSIAISLGVSQTLISYINNNKRWKHDLTPEIIS